MQPARGESCPSGQRRDPAAPGEDKFLSPGNESLHISTNSLTRGQIRRSTGSIPPGRVRSPPSHWVFADWLGLLEPARGESCTSGQRRGPAAPAEDKFLSLGNKSLHISTTSLTLARIRRSPGSMPPRMVRNPQPNWVIAHWLGLMEPARGESCLSGQRRRLATPGKHGVSSPDSKPFHISADNSSNLGSKTGIPRVDTATHGVVTLTTLAGC